MSEARFSRPRAATSALGLPGVAARSGELLRPVIKQRQVAVEAVRSCMGGFLKRMQGELLPNIGPAYSLVRELGPEHPACRQNGFIFLANAAQMLGTEMDIAASAAAAKHSMEQAGLLKAMGDIMARTTWDAMVGEWKPDFRADPQLSKNWSHEAKVEFYGRLRDYWKGIEGAYEIQFGRLWDQAWAVLGAGVAGSAFAVAVTLVDPVVTAAWLNQALGIALAASWAGILVVMAVVVVSILSVLALQKGVEAVINAIKKALRKKAFNKAKQELHTMEDWENWVDEHYGEDDEGGDEGGPDWDGLIWFPTPGLDYVWAGGGRQAPHEMQAFTFAVIDVFQAYGVSSLAGRATTAQQAARNPGVMDTAGQFQYASTAP